LAISAFSALFVGVCLYPHCLRLSRPSLYCDDVVRLEAIQTQPLAALLFRPFNEHVAPLFELVTSLTWSLSGGRLTRAPLVFTAMSLLPFALSLALLGYTLWSELRSICASLSGVAIFSISPLYTETAWWYSASTFAWALLATLLAWNSARIAVQRGSISFGILTILAVACAPAFSAIGFLAAPAAMIRGLLDPARPKTRRSRLLAVAPIAGVIVYLAVCGPFKYRDAAAQGVQQGPDRVGGLYAAARAPIDVLLPRLVGAAALDENIPRHLDVLISAAASLVVLGCAWRSRHRHVLVGGLLLIAAGYALIYPFRMTTGPHALMLVQRYHMFPQLGLVFLLSVLVARFARRIDQQPLAAMVFSTSVGCLLLSAHFGPLKGYARYLAFPDQKATLVAIEQLQSVCESAGITREQALSALDSVQPRWFPFPDRSALAMLGTCARTGRVPQARVRGMLVAALSTRDLESLCGAMDATPYLNRFEPNAERTTLAAGRLARTFRVERTAAGNLVSAGPPAYLEFELDTNNAASPAGSMLHLPPGSSELWWADAAGRWSELRSVHWRVAGSSAGEAESCVLLLSALPHWRNAKHQRLRFFYKDPGPIALDAPRLLR
jgi:hypothetical protein